MLGRLPTSIELHGVEYPINTDFRAVFAIFSAMNDDTLNDREKAYILLSNIYGDITKIPKGDIQEAYEKAIAFLSCGEKQESNKKSPSVINWEKDEQLLFPAVNKVAGCEVRLVEYMHWWTFLGYFQNIDREDTYGYILYIRQKMAKHKKLEKHEQEFLNANRDLCMLKTPKQLQEECQSDIMSIYNSLREGGKT